MTLRQQILQIVKEAFAKGEQRGSSSSPNFASPKIHAHYTPINDVSQTRTGDVLTDLLDPSLIGYVIYDEKNYKTILWNNGKLIAYKKDGLEDFNVRQIRNVSLDHLFRYLSQ